MTLPTRTDSGILLAAAGTVHRNRGDGLTICGRTVVNPVSVTDAQVRIYKLGTCPQCWPYRLRGRP